MDEPKRILTRKELHDLVWSVPIQKLAEQYGLSDRGFTKTCERHLVPVPGRGHWAKIAAGLQSKKTPLRAVQNTELHTVHIGGRPAPHPSDYLTEVLAAARTEIESEDQALLNAPERVNSKSSTVNLQPIVKTKCGPAVEAFLDQLFEQKVDRHGFIPAYDLRVTPADLDRVGRVLTDLQTELRPYGFILKLDLTKERHLSASLSFRKDGSSVRLSFESNRKRVAEPSGFGWQNFTYQHVGRLTLQLFGEAKGSTKKWSDTDTKKIEDRLPQIVESIRLNLVANREQDKKREIERDRRAHMAHRRELAALRAKREDERLAMIQDMAAMRKECNDLRETITLISIEHHDAPEYRKMIAWAQARLADLETRTSIEAVEAMLVERQLYTEPDALFDPEGDPPPKQNHWDD